MALVLVVLAVILLVGFARQSLSLALQASEAKRDLQLRWGTASVSEAILDRAGMILSEHVRRNSANPGDGRLLYPCTETVRLGDMDFRLVLDDENRKVNVNRIYITGGSERVLESMHQLGRGTAATRLRPEQGDLRNVAMRPFASWGQVYALDELPPEEAPARWLMENTGELTCWGSGRIHFRGSSDPALETVARYATGPVTAARLVNKRRQDPSLELDDLLDSLAARLRDKNRLKSWLTDESLCFSLWIAVDGVDRSWYQLVVTEVTADGSSQLHRFTW
jgi:hypothetical protein